MLHMEDCLDLPLRMVLQAMQNRIMLDTKYFGIKTLKSPIDFWVYQEILFDTRPDVLVEIGNFQGGSALALAHVMDRLGHGRILCIDIDQAPIPDQVRAHPRITCIEGDACEAFDDVRASIGARESVMVVEDSSHTYDNTRKVLETYGALVTPGQYFIVEDGICHHGLDLGPKPGPYEAIDDFVAQHPEFEIDRGKETFLVTWNPKGFLRKVR